MAYFAQLDSNNIVQQIIVVNDDELKKKKAFWDPAGLFVDDNEHEKVGISFCQKHWERTTGVKNSKWKQTFRDPNLRGNYACKGMVYMTGVKTLGVASTDVFMFPQPFPSWVLGETAQWVPPFEPPELTKFDFEKGMRYYWNESKYKDNPERAWELKQIGGNCEGCEDTSMVWQNPK